MAIFVIVLVGLYLVPLKPLYLAITTAKAYCGDTNAQLELGDIALMTRGEDYTKALKWLTRAAEKGNPRAQLALGIMYSEGNGVEHNHSEALKWLTKAAAQGEEGAQFLIQVEQEKYNHVRIERD